MTNINLSKNPINPKQLLGKSRIFNVTADLQPDGSYQIVITMFGITLLTINLKF